MSVMGKYKMNYNLEESQLTKKITPSLLKEKRLILGMTQKQVADKADVVLQQYQKFESGERNIMNCSFGLACRIVEALEMDVRKFYHGEYLCGFEEKMNEISNG